MDKKEEVSWCVYASGRSSPRPRSCSRPAVGGIPVAAPAARRAASSHRAPRRRLTERGHQGRRHARRRHARRHGPGRPVARQRQQLVVHPAQRHRGSARREGRDPQRDRTGPRESCRSLSDGWPDLHVQAPRRHQVPRRDGLQRRGRRVQLRAPEERPRGRFATRTTTTSAPSSAGPRTRTSSRSRRSIATTVELQAQGPAVELPHRPGPAAAVRDPEPDGAQGRRRGQPRSVQERLCAGPGQRHGRHRARSSSRNGSRTTTSRSRRTPTTGTPSASRTSTRSSSSRTPTRPPSSTRCRPATSTSPRPSSPSDIASLSVGPDLQVIDRGESCNIGLLQMNHKHKPFDNAKIRKAIGARAQQAGVHRHVLRRARRAGRQLDAAGDPVLQAARPCRRTTPRRPRTQIAASGLTGDDLTVELLVPVRRRPAVHA